jgi:uncharacterized RDD family membrane protein YckC
MDTTESSVSWGADTFDRGVEVNRVKGSETRGPSILAARMAAIIIDGVVLVVPVLAIAYLFSLAFPHHGFFYARSGTSTTTTLSGVSQTHYTVSLPLSAVLLISALSLSYFFVCEAVWGRTVGKRAMGLRVRSTSGGPAGPLGIAIRTLLRMIDGILFYLVGWIVALSSGSARRRIGDLLGGTVVTREDGAYEYRPRMDTWKVLSFPAACLAVALATIFTLGLDTALSEPERAVALVRSYVKAREDGNASLACSLLTQPQQREIVAIETGSYASAQSSRCPEFILRDEPNSHLLNPELVQFAASPLSGVTEPFGGVVIFSTQGPGLRLIAVPEGGQMKLDMRGVQKLEFIRGCTVAGHLSSGQCTCTFDLARSQDQIPEGALTPAAIRALQDDRARCMSALDQVSS